MRYLLALRNIKYIFSFFKDSNVPVYKKLLMTFGLAYFLLPFDLVPEVVLGYGIIDDIAILTILLNYLNEYFQRYRDKKEKDTENYIEDFDYDIKDDK